MDGIKIEVTGNIARVIERPAKITSGTIGLPVDFTFDSQWDGLHKVAVFRAGPIIKTVDNPGAGTTVPWEVLDKPCAWLSIGVYGTNEDGSIAIPSIWANVSVIHVGVNPDGDPSTDPTLPIWQELLNLIKAKPAARITHVLLKASEWIGSNKLYSQVIEIDGITPYSQVNLAPSVEQLSIFYEKDITFTTENRGGVITVYVIGQKPENDYTIQAEIVEVIE